MVRFIIVYLLSDTAMNMKIGSALMAANPTKVHIHNRFGHPKFSCLYVALARHFSSETSISLDKKLISFGLI